MKMEPAEVVSRLDYVSELLQQIQHSTSSSMHACCCDVCSSVSSLRRSCITRALQEVAAVTAHLKAKDKPFTQSLGESNPPGADRPKMHSSGGIESHNVTYCKEGQVDTACRGTGSDPPVLSSTMDSGLQGTAFNSDWSSSPIYDSEDAGGTEVEQGGTLPKLQLFSKEGVDLVSPGTPQYPACRAPRDVPLTPGEQSSHTSPFLTQPGSRQMLPVPDSPQFQPGLWPPYAPSPYSLGAASPFWLPGYSLPWSPLMLSPFNQTLTNPEQTPQPTDNFHRYSEQFSRLHPHFLPKSERLNQSFSFSPQRNPCNGTTSDDVRFSPHRLPASPASSADSVQLPQAPHSLPRPSPSSTSTSVQGVRLPSGTFTSPENSDFPKQTVTSTSVGRVNFSVTDESVQYVAAQVENQPVSQAISLPSTETLSFGKDQGVHAKHCKADPAILNTNRCHGEITNTLAPEEVDRTEGSKDGDLVKDNGAIGKSDTQLKSNGTSCNSVGYLYETDQKQLAETTDALKASFDDLSLGSERSTKLSQCSFTNSASSESKTDRNEIMVTGAAKVLLTHATNRDTVKSILGGKLSSTVDETVNLPQSVCETKEAIMGLLDSHSPGESSGSHSEQKVCSTRDIAMNSDVVKTAEINGRQDNDLNSENPSDSGPKNEVQNQNVNGEAKYRSELKTESDVTNMASTTDASLETDQHRRHSNSTEQRPVCTNDEFSEKMLQDGNNILYSKTNAKFSTSEERILQEKSLNCSDIMAQILQKSPDQSQADGKDCEILHVNPEENLSLTVRPVVNRNTSLKCLSNLQISPGTVCAQETSELDLFKSEDKKYSVLNEELAGDWEAGLLESNKENAKRVFSASKRHSLPAMGVRRSQVRSPSNKNNNTCDITETLTHYSVTDKDIIDQASSETCSDAAEASIRPVGGESCAPVSGKVREQAEEENDDIFSTKEPTWGAPALSAAQYLSDSLAQGSPVKQVRVSNTLDLIDNRSNQSEEATPMVLTNAAPETSPEIFCREQTAARIKTANGLLCLQKPGENVSQVSGLQVASASSSDPVTEHRPKSRLAAVTGGMRDRQELNASLPMSFLKTGSGLKGLEGYKHGLNESYEGNQSFPKTGLTNHSRRSLLDKSRTPVDRRRSNFAEAEKTPRNRRSIFGFSPPDQHQYLKQRSPNAPAEKLLPQVESSPMIQDERRETVSPPCTLASGKASSATDGIWQSLDASEVLAQGQECTPSVREVLFNTVTSSLCVLDKQKGGKILSVNESFQLMIGLHEKVVGQRLLRFLKFMDTVDELNGCCLQSFVRADGSIVSVQGVLAMCVDSRGRECPVSVWTLPVSSKPQLTICVVEVVTTFTSDLCFLPGGDVVTLASQFEEMLGYEYLAVEDDQEERVRCRLSGVDENKADIPQQAKIKTWNGIEHLATVVVENIEEPSEEGEVPVCRGIITLCGNLCGLIVSQSDGTVTFCDNEYFRMYLGYGNFSQQVTLEQLLSEVTRIGQCGGEDSVVTAAQDSSSHAWQPLDLTLRDVSHLSCDDLEDRPDRGQRELCLPIRCFQEKENLTLSASESDDHEVADADSVDDAACPLSDLLGTAEFPRPPEHSKLTPPKKTSTPYKGKMFPQRGMEENRTSPVVPVMKPLENGTYRAMFLHANGGRLLGSFKVGSVAPPAGQQLVCLWIYLHINTGADDFSDQSTATSDSGSEGDCEPGRRRTRVAGGVRACDDEEEEEDEEEDLEWQDRTVDPSLGQMIVDQVGLNQSRNAATGEDMLDLEAAVAGDFCEKYFVLEALGQGTFGFVRRAAAIEHKKSVVVKFIKKRNMFRDGWTVDVDSGLRIPLEVSILKDLTNDYIIKVQDVYQNADFVQMVMEDFGDVDLFDFIDQVCLDEPLACHLFRQILWGVEYLHSCRIVHRDIKDENVVLRKDFRCKLIDFGSAVYLLPGEERFTKFRGTLEYCSPEVFSGSSYRGPELDMWALGVTLYTMVYRVNPFCVDDMPDTFAHLELPASEAAGTGGEGKLDSWDLLELLSGLLTCDPASRYTMTRALHSDWLRQIVSLSGYSWDNMFGCEPVDQH